MRSRNQLASENTQLREIRLFFLLLLSRNFHNQLGSNFHRFEIVCICWDTPSEKTGLWQLPIVSSAFKRPLPIRESVSSKTHTRWNPLIAPRLRLCLGTSWGGTVRVFCSVIVPSIHARSKTRDLGMWWLFMPFLQPSISFTKPFLTKNFGLTLGLSDV